MSQSGVERTVRIRDGKIPASLLPDRTIYGTGSPLGLVTATPGTKYVDGVGTLGAWEWIKKSGTGTSGWEVIYGDTGRVAVGAAGRLQATGEPDKASITRLDLRRTVSTVFIYIEAGITVTASPITVLALPAGFGVDPLLYLPPGYEGTSWTLSGNFFRVYSRTAGMNVRAYWALPANAAWPTALPSTA